MTTSKLQDSLAHQYNDTYANAYAFTADYIFDGQTLWKNAILHLDEDGKVLALLKAPDREALIGAESFSGILVPGLINAHCHVELSHLQGAIEKGTGLPGFASRVMQLRRLPKEEILAAITAADLQMWESGIQAVGDICNTVDSLSQKQASKLRYRNFIECLGFLPGQAEQRFSDAHKVWEAFAQINPASTLVPHAPYSVSKDLFAKIKQALKEIPDKHNRICSIHNQESAPENELFLAGTGDFVAFYNKLGIDLKSYQPSGMTSLQTVLPYLALAGSRLLFVHNTFTHEEDLTFARQLSEQTGQQFTYVLCPGANLYIENRLPDITLLIKSGVDIALGTDSLASNDQLSIAKEMQHILKAYPNIPKELVLSWATYNGAQALGFEGQLGSFQKGRQPGVVLLSENLELIRRIH